MACKVAPRFEKPIQLCEPKRGAFAVVAGGADAKTIETLSCCQRFEVDRSQCFGHAWRMLGGCLEDAWSMLGARWSTVGVGLARGLTQGWSKQARGFLLGIHRFN